MDVYDRSWSLNMMYVYIPAVFWLHRSCSKQRDMYTVECIGTEMDNKMYQNNFCISEFKTSANIRFKK